MQIKMRFGCTWQNECNEASVSPFFLLGMRRRLASVLLETGARVQKGERKEESLKSCAHTQSQSQLLHGQLECCL